MCAGVTARLVCRALKKQHAHIWAWAQEVEGSALPAVAKGALRTRLVALQKRVYEEQKAAAAANKARAASAAIDAADAAVAAGRKFAIMQLEVHSCRRNPNLACCTPFCTPLVKYCAARANSGRVAQCATACLLQVRALHCCVRYLSCHTLTGRRPVTILCTALTWPSVKRLCVHSCGRVYMVAGWLGQQSGRGGLAGHQQEAPQPACCHLHLRRKYVVPSRASTLPHIKTSCTSVISADVDANTLGCHQVMTLPFLHHLHRQGQGSCSSGRA